MVECPVCKSMCFDDMEVCYGCMHRFDLGYVYSDGLTSSGLPDFEVEEPKAPKRIMAPTATTPFVLPVDGQGYNLVISVQPVKKEDEDVWRSGMRKAVAQQPTWQEPREAVQPDALQENAIDALSLLEDEEVIDALALESVLDEDAQALTYA